MAVTAQITVPGKVRHPGAVIGLTVVTLGVYLVVWYYKINAEMRDIGAWAQDTRLARSRPWSSVAATTIGCLLVVPSIVSWLGTVRRLSETERLTTGRAGPTRGLITALAAGWVFALAANVRGAVALSVLALGVSLYVVGTIQSRLNRALAAAR